MHYIIAGASGLVGQALLSLLQNQKAEAADLKITLLSRSETKLTKLKSRFVLLSPAGLTYRECAVLDLKDAVFINLAGESIALKRLGKSRQKALLDSRLATINLCRELIEQGCGTPALFVQASSLSILKDDDIEQNGSESAAPADAAVEACFADNPTAGILKQIEAAVRTVPCPNLSLRLPIVLGENAVFCRMLRSLPPIALLDGSNYLPTASVHDVVRALLFCVEHRLTGSVNVSSPFYFTAGELLKAGAGAHGLLPPLPLMQWMLRLGALFDLRSLLLLENKKVRAQRLTELGFKFADLTLEACLHSR